MKHAYYFASVGFAGALAIFTAVFPLASSPTSDQIEATAAATLPESEPAPEPQIAAMTFFGDIMLGRNVEALTNKHGQDYLFEKLDNFLTQQSYVIANLEGPIVSDHTQTPTGSFVFSFLDTSANLLARHGFNLVSLANNHTLNQGDDGFLETEAHLDTAGILHMGHPIEMGKDFVVQTTVNDLPITFAGFNMTFNYDDPDAAVATITQLATASTHPIMVFMHWGTEYELHSNTTQQQLAHRLIDAGADLIIGAHPHVVEEVERYNNKLIFYSLGNFIFDQYFSTDTQQGLAVGITLTAGGDVSAALYPLQSAFSQPELMPEPARTAFLQALAERSGEDLFSSVAVGQIP